VTSRSGGTAALVIYEGGTFSPFEGRSRYSAPVSSSNTGSSLAELVRPSTGERVADYDLEPLDPSSLLAAADRGVYGTVIPDPTRRYPFSPTALAPGRLNAGGLRPRGTEIHRGPVPPLYQLRSLVGDEHRNRRGARLGAGIPERHGGPHGGVR